MNLNYIMIGQRIKELRQKKNISQRALSELIDISTTSMSYIESGYRFMSVETLIKLANALEVSVDLILAECLCCHMVASDMAFADVLRDCTSFECRVLIDNANALKKALRDNRFLQAKIPY